MEKIEVLGTEIAIKEKEEYISLTDIARYKNPEHPADVMKNWTRSKDTIEFLGLWERINNPLFKVVEFDQFRSQWGNSSVVLSPQRWIDATNAIGIISNSGKYGGRLVCLSNLESPNAVFINENVPQDKRLIELNEIAIH